MEQVSITTDRRSRVGEGPIWDSRTNRLLYVDIPEGVVSKLDPETREEEIIQLAGDNVSFVIPFSSDPNKLLIGRNKQVCEIQWHTKEISVCCEVEPGMETRFNDGKCDCTGRVWAGTMGLMVKPNVFSDIDGCLYAMDSKNKISKHRSGVRISNGLAWDKTNKTMFYIDSIPQTIFAYDFNSENGTISNERILVDFKENKSFERCGLPDGMAIDDEDNLWVCCFGGGCVLRIDTTNGKLMRKVNLPAQKITSCCFGGPNYDVLYVTSAYHGMSDGERISHPDAGAVFKVTNLGVKGRAPSFFHA